MSAIDRSKIVQPDLQKLRSDNNEIKIVILYGSLRKTSNSKMLAKQVFEILQIYNCNVKIFDPAGLPAMNQDNFHELPTKAKELHDLVKWCDGMVWCSPEIHGSMTGLMKSMIDWIPLSFGAIRPTQSKTLAVMQVSGGSQSFNAVNQMRILGRWMRCITIPNQSSIPHAYKEFDANGNMKPSSYFDRVVDVCEELVKFTHLTKSCREYLVDRYSERS